MTGEQQARTSSLISLGANILLTIVKIAVGIWAGSDALFADGIHSGIDILAAGAALSALTIAYRPADEEHPYGHGKAEDLASSVVSLVLVIAGAYISFSSVRGVLSPPHTLGLAALFVAVMSLVIKEVLYRYTKRLGKQLNSPALNALAQDHRSDIWGSWAAILGIAGSMLGRYIHVSALEYADPVAGFFVGVLILRTSFQMGSAAVNALMEQSVNEDLLDAYRNLVSAVSGIERLDKLRARNLGHYIVVDVRASVHGSKSIQEGHDISRAVKTSIMEKHPEVQEVLVHLNPYYPEDSTVGDGYA